jgi:hypothetical protein
VTLEPPVFAIENESMEPIELEVSRQLLFEILSILGIRGRRRGGVGVRGPMSSWSKSARTSSSRYRGSPK